MIREQPPSNNGDDRKEPDADSSPAPRASVIAIGYLFQSIGLVLLLGAFCFWPFSSRFVTPAEAPPQRWTEYLLGDRAAAALFTIGLATTFIGGIGLVAVGVGLQGERRSSGRAAMAVTAAMAASYWVSGGLLIVKTGSWLHALTATAFATLATLLLVSAAHCAAVLRRFPPPSDQNVVSDEFVDALGRRSPPGAANDDVD